MAGWYAPYVPVAKRQAKAKKEMDRLRKKGLSIQPVTIEGRAIARSFWGKGWCDHLESFSDYENRLPRGRSYVRNGFVCHLDIAPGAIEAIVSGSELYRVAIAITPLEQSKWKRIQKQCGGQIGSIIELLQGRLSSAVMAVVTAPLDGLFPLPREIRLSCSCPDSAIMCKHVAAALYGVGNRLDADPGLLFLMRGVDPQELIAGGVALPEASGGADSVLADDSLADIFGIDLDLGGAPPAAPAPDKKKSSPSSTKKSSSAKARGQAPKPKKPRPFKPTGKSVSRLRGKSGLSAAEFAERIGVSVGSVYRWENARGVLALHGRCVEALQRLRDELEA